MERFLLATDAVLLIENAIVANTSYRAPKKNKHEKELEENSHHSPEWKTVSSHAGLCVRRVRRNAR